ncbi:MAG: DUF4430 domain-containing protein [Patescibacteria group bacterium]|jgi:hypothetical protein
MFKRNIFKILAVVFFLLAGASYYNSNKNPIKPFDNTQGKQIARKIISLTKTLTPTIFIKGSENPTPTEILPTQIIIPTSITKGSENPTPTIIPPTSAPQGLKVSLTINGSSVGEIDVNVGANQCDVLSQALSQGKIQSLNMRYNNDLGTNAVYQINGIGKENAVWWGYKVNSQSPSQGCSYVKVNNGDNTQWSYLGN